MKSQHLYEESWRAQREREAEASSSRGHGVRLKQLLSVSRYDVATELVCALRPQGGRFADVGFGRGEMIRRLAVRFDRLSGIDVATTEIEHFRRSLTPEEAMKMDLQCVDLDGEWPLDDASCDVVACLAVLEHLFDPYATAQRLARLLRPGGLLVIEVPNIAYLKYRISLLFGVFPKTSGDPVGWDGGHLHYFTRNSLIELFAGFRCHPVAIRGTGFLGRMRSAWPSLLTSDLVVAFEKQ